MNKLPPKLMFIVGGLAGLAFAALIVWLIAPGTAGASSPESFDRISVADFQQKFEKGQVHVLDVRDIDQYKAAHVPTALQIPLALVEGEIQYLPKDKPFVVYCTCPNEESSGQAAMILARGGIQAVALKGGLEAWKNAGLPLASGLEVVR